ncbi:MAG: hypothetical protein ACK47B_13495 [Armatimonadota bacterium]
MERPWEPALLRAARALNAPGAGVEWVVVGSVASVVQGCEMTPRDLDLIFPSLDALRRAVVLLSQAEEVPSPEIVSQSFPGGFEWHKAQWSRDGFVTEAVFIASGGGIPDSPGGDGIWEGGRHIWSRLRRISFHGERIPVVPLEIQLESQLRRGVVDRAEVIGETLRFRGYDPELLLEGLSTAHLALWQQGIPSAE